MTTHILVPCTHDPARNVLAAAMLDFGADACRHHRGRPRGSIALPVRAGQPRPGDGEWRAALAAIAAR